MVVRIAAAVKLIACVFFGFFFWLLFFALWDLPVMFYFDLKVGGGGALGLNHVQKKSTPLPLFLLVI